MAREFETSPHNPSGETREAYSECGMFAVFLNDSHVADAASMTVQGLVALQHRAEGATGIYVSNGTEHEFTKGLGTVAVATDEGRRLRRVRNAKTAIGHTRYPTSGTSRSTSNIQPLQKDQLVLAHHGNLINAQEVRDSLDPFPIGGRFPDSDSWIALNAIDQAEGDTLAEKVVNAARELEGGFAIIVSDGESMVATRDPHGVRPLFVGMMGMEANPQGYMFAVESSAFRNFGVSDHFREVKPGETIQVNKDGIRRVALEPKEEGYCAFEFVYMMSPDSVFANKNVYKTRVRAGRQLWAEQPVEPAPGKKLLVMPVPNSGRPAALGFYHEAKKVLGDQIEYDERLLVNTYMGRNFIKETQNRAAYLKFYPIIRSFLGEEIEDAVDDYFPYLLDDNFHVVSPERTREDVPESEYELVIIDDSIVRGDTWLDIMDIMSMIGDYTKHGRVASPEIHHPCRLGVAMPTFGEFIANRIPDINVRARALKTASLGHLSVGGMVKAIGISKDRLCTECFDGHGPYAHRVERTIPLNEEVVIDNAPPTATINLPEEE